MRIPIQASLPITSPAVPQIAIPAARPGSEPGSFGELFRSSVQQVQGFQQSAHQQVEQFLSGETEDLHKVALATQQAELSFDLFLQVRNKVVQAYQEVMRMQI